MAKTILFGAIAWIGLAALTLLMLWPNIPSSPMQWVLYIVFGPPLYVLLEGFGSWLFSKEHGEAISKERFSGSRILIAIPAVLVVTALCWWLSWLITK